MENFFAEVGQELTDEQLGQVTGGATIGDGAAAALAFVPSGQATRINGVITGTGVGGSSLSFSTLLSSFSHSTSVPSGTGIPSLGTGIPSFGGL